MIGRPDLGTPETKPSSYYVCSLHFEKSVIKYKPQLRPDALPTKLLPSLPNTSSISSKPECKEISTQTELHISNSNMPSAINTKGADIKSKPVPTSHNSQTEQQTSTALSSNIPRKRSLSEESKVSKLKKSKLQNDLDNIKQEIKQEVQF